MKIPSKIETNAILLLTQMEESVVKGYRFSNAVILAMNDLKKAIDEDEQLMSRDLENLFNRVSKTIK